MNSSYLKHNFKGGFFCFGLLFVGWMEHMIEVPLSEQRLKNDGPAMTEGTS
jgi:hypothetical protein